VNAPLVSLHSKTQTTQKVRLDLNSCSVISTDIAIEKLAKSAMLAPAVTRPNTDCNKPG
jgi:hypothetical protein